jgi:hypothetical protein
VSASRPKQKTISRHYKRRRADEKAGQLNDQLVYKRTKVGYEAYKSWLAFMGLPEWSTRFAVRPARLRFHYRVVALDR